MFLLQGAQQGATQQNYVEETCESDAAFFGDELSGCSDIEEVLRGVGAGNGGKEIKLPQKGVGVGGENVGKVNKDPWKVVSIHCLVSG